MPLHRWCPIDQGGGGLSAGGGPSWAWHYRPAQVKEKAQGHRASCSGLLASGLLVSAQQRREGNRVSSRCSATRPVKPAEAAPERSAAGEKTGVHGRPGCLAAVLKDTEGFGNTLGARRTSRQRWLPCARPSGGEVLVSCVCVIGLQVLAGWMAGFCGLGRERQSRAPYLSAAR